jgi:hypothetical protein
MTKRAACPFEKLLQGNLSWVREKEEGGMREEWKIAHQRL